jgi:hypothetical protein
MNRLCTNLQLTITREDGPESDLIRMHLVDLATFTEVEVEYQTGMDPKMLQRQYYLKEAIVIAMRRLVSKAIAAGMIKLATSSAPGGSHLSPSDTSRPRAKGSLEDIQLLIPPDAE